MMVEFKNKQTKKNYTERDLRADFPKDWIEQFRIYGVCDRGCGRCYENTALCFSVYMLLSCVLLLWLFVEQFFFLPLFLFIHLVFACVLLKRLHAMCASSFLDFTFCSLDLWSFYVVVLFFFCLNFFGEVWCAGVKTNTLYYNSRYTCSLWFFFLLFENYYYSLCLLLLHLPWIRNNCSIFYSRWGDGSITFWWNNWNYEFSDNHLEWNNYIHDWNGLICQHFNNFLFIHHFIQITQSEF